MMGHFSKHSQNGFTRSRKAGKKADDGMIYTKQARARKSKELFTPRKTKVAKEHQGILTTL